MEKVKKEIDIPRILHEIHGEKTRVSTLTLIYFTAFFAATLIIIQLLPYGLADWKYLLLTIIMLDISGGVVANLSTSTNKYYQIKKQLRVPYLLVHVLQPLALYLIFPEYLYYFIFLGGYTILISLFINAIKDREFQQNLASSFLVLGFVFSLLFDIDIYTIYIIGGMYMTKIILGFTVRRPSFYE